MREVAPGVWQLRGLPPNAINAYLVGDVLIDAATRLARRRILRQLRGRRVFAHALTHAHPDHQGATHAICTELKIPLGCGERDVRAMESGEVSAARGLVGWFQRSFWTGPPHQVDTVLREGDTVAGFTVLETPGHTPGHLAFWRESDRTLIAGDVLTNMDLRTGMPGLHEPPVAFTRDPERNRESIRRLARLEAAVCLFGHGAPLRDPGRLRDFAQSL